MNIYDTANQLAHEIRESEEYKQYKASKNYIANNAELKEKVEEFEQLRYDVQLLSLQGETEEGKKKKLEEMYTILVQDQEIKKYFDLEIKFNVMIADINKIIAEAIRDVL